jgi:hypothetical protein
LRKTLRPLRLKNRPLDNRRRDERQKKQPQIHRLKKEIENTNCTNLHELKIEEQITK